MVSISAKEPTKRTATACCSVYFSNPSSVTLICENRAKKGDVLGVARIAGIMAAKQTSTLIPLCHPIAITHVNVDVEIGGMPSEEEEKESQEASQAARKSVSIPWAGTGQGDAYKWNQDFKTSSGLGKAGLAARGSGDGGGDGDVKVANYGRIDIIATVSCDGKTGVEMEALTAASTAALTVYDMCKAVDKGMRIDGLRVTRKEGGKSGTWVEGESVT